MNKFYEKSFYSTCKDMNKFNKHNFNLLYPAYEKQFNVFNKYLKGNNILDIGCGVGYFLFAAKIKGFNCLGIEISKEAAKYTQNQLGVKVLTGEIESAILPSDYFDGVRIAHVLEHLSNPVATLNKINRVLKKNGILEISIPNPYCLLTHLTNLYHKVRGNYKRTKYSCSLSYPSHIYAFPYKTIILLMKKTRFRILRIDSVGIEKIAINLSLKSFNGKISTIVELLGNIFSSNSVCRIYAKKI
ncbi:MAG: class I SAM-dependent methyltransferase [bacterium]|nr:class I SAM-dependent methyltransferase [bacterium]